MLHPSVTRPRALLTIAALVVAGGPSVFGHGAASEEGLPLMQRFPPDVYQGHYQVNDLTIAPDGRLYGTTQRAIVRYDGVRWERLDYPTLWAWRLAAAADGRVYVSGDDEVGYFADDATGRAVYHSLTKDVPAAALPLGNVRGAKVGGDAVAFAPEKGWLVWQGGRFHFTPAPAPGRTSVHAVNGVLYASATSGGLYRWTGSEWQPFAAATPLGRAVVTGLAALPGGRLLALATPPALFDIGADGATASPWAGTAAKAVPALRPLGLLTLPDGRIAAFTRSSGVVLVSPDGGSLLRYEKTHGIPSNTTYGLAVDPAGGLWTGGTNGLVRLDLVTPATVFDERNGPGPGGMRSFSRQEGVFYAGAVDAVHRLVPADPASGAPARFERIPGPASTINDLAPHPLGLLVATTNTLQLYRPESGFRVLLQRPDDLSVVWTTPADPTRVYLGGDRSLIVGRLDASGFTIDYESTTFGSSELITPIGGDTIWVGTRARGFFRVRAGAGADGWRRPAIDQFAEKEGLPPTRGYTAAFVAPWGASFFTSEGTWALDEAARRFTPEPAFQLPGGPRHGFPSTLDGAGRLWASGGRVDGRDGRPLGWYEFVGGQPRRAAVWHPAPAPLQPLAGVVGFLTFYRDPAGDVVWGKSPHGVVRLETSRLTSRSAPSWRPRLHGIVAAGTAQPLAPATPPRYPAATEHTVFRFSPGRLDAGAATYRTRLLGHDDRWSPVTTHPEISFTNLEGGPFTLEVVATDAAGGESAPLRFAFSVAPPWHRRPAAFLGYALALAGGVFGFVRWRLARAARRERQLEAIVAERTRDLATARDQAEAASRAKSAFLAAMSHELRTPLNGVIGYAQLLGGDARLATDQRERLRIVHQSGEHLLRMINDVLDLAKIEAGKIELRPGPFALVELINDVAAAHTPAATAKRLTLHRDLAPDLPAWVEGDAQKVRQILDNLLGNAVKFTQRGGVTLRVNCRAGSPDPAVTAPPPNQTAASGDPALQQLDFAIIDTGPGIAPGDQAKLFQPFEQARSHRPASPGTGLGLAISRALVERMGGALTLASEFGAGSTFSFSLPLPALSTPAPLATRASVTGYDGSRRRVLIVDDHAINRSLLTDLLAPLGFDCAECASGENAIARLAAGHEPWPDLAIVDLRMERMDGLELTRRLRAMPRGRDLKVLLTSASVISFNPAEAREAGCDDFLPKPFRTADLVEKIGALLALHWHSATPPESNPLGYFPAEAIHLPEAARAALREVLAQGDLEAFRAALARVRLEHPAAAARWDALDEAAAGFQLSKLRALLDQP